MQVYIHIQNWQKFVFSEKRVTTYLQNKQTYQLTWVTFSCTNCHTSNSDRTHWNFIQTFFATRGQILQCLLVQPGCWHFLLWVKWTVNCSTCYHSKLHSCPRHYLHLVSGQIQTPVKIKDSHQHVSELYNSCCSLFFMFSRSEMTSEHLQSSYIIIYL